MKVSAKSGTTVEPIPPGVYNAICVSVVGIGPQESPWGAKNQIIITWEFPDITFEYDGEIKPKVHSQFFTATLGGGDKPSALRELLEGWRGRPFTKEEESGFELKNLLGVPVMLVMQLKPDGKNTKIAAASKYNGAAMKPYNPLTYYDAEDHDPSAFDELHDWIKAKINKVGSRIENAVDNIADRFDKDDDEANAELQAAAMEAQSYPSEEDDDVPF